ncbi:transcriptional regulator, LacI family [Reichenbachiella agariperforans]|uniref:Transcriptional regulator, LacI family n=1 Tax=Reichenbachiella agariperforans TaxID=156994 RepID=A0A1M6L056_REIAG|nr:LacI family DNA-binding transcriptional regulator [Reichenbachiella agariperforans]SHJ64580.1 transcriptional regulator, LacI family [Reichenbachiella agariperforans]
MKQSAVTIKDLAKELGISPSTVSRALKDHPDISPETKRLVNALAEKLDYEPNTIAMSLRSKRTNTIGVIIPEIVHFFFSTVISGIEEVAYKKGYTVMFCQSNEDYEKEVIDTKALLAHRVDGLLISYSKETTNFDHFREIQRKNIPLVFFDRVPTDELHCSTITINDFESAESAVDHLVIENHLRIAHLAGPQNLNISKQRLAGYKRGIEKHKLYFEEGYVQYCGKGDFEEGYRCTNELLKLSERPNAIFANNDVAAYGAMKAIKDAGLKIPEDIAIMGFSNWQFASLTEPQLTSIAQPGIEMGKAAARRLILELEAKDEDLPPVDQVLKTDIIVRGSTRSTQK